MEQTSFALLDIMKDISRKINVTYKVPGTDTCIISVGDYLNDICNELTKVNTYRKSIGNSFRLGLNSELSTKYNYVIYETNGTMNRAIVGLRCSILRVEEYIVLQGGIPIEYMTNSMLKESPNKGVEFWISKLVYKNKTLKITNEQGGKYSVRISKVPSWIDGKETSQSSYRTVKYDRDYYRALQQEFVGYYNYLLKSMEM